MITDGVAELITLGPEIGVPTYVEIIVVDKKITTTNLASQPCFRNCNHVRGYRIERDLIDPSTVEDVQEVGRTKNVFESTYLAFLRNFTTGTLSQILFSDPVETKNSIVFVNNEIDVSELQQVADLLVTLPNILPSRMVWPGE